MGGERIYLSLAHMGGGEQKYIQEAFDTNWVVPLGPNVDAFEEELQHFLGGEHYVTALSAGTAAIHLGLVLAGVEAGDEVICQSFTFSASANPIAYQGARPVFVDSEADTWNMDPMLLEEAIEGRIKAVGKAPKAIIPVHLYGMPAKIDEILAIAERYGIAVVEDAAEAMGSEYKGRRCGTFGAFGALSFNGNKMITTSGGGALVSRTEEEKVRARFYATQAREKAPYYQHEKIGYNYRMSNISAGIGRGQMEVVAEHISKRRANHAFYKEAFSHVEGIKVMDNPSGVCSSNFWLTTILIDPKVYKPTPNEVREALERENIETRLLWKPLHRQPVFKECSYYGGNVAWGLFSRGLCLPSGPLLTEDDLGRVVESVKAVLRKK